MKKRLSAFALALCLVLAVVAPLSTGHALQNETTVYVTVSNKGALALASDGITKIINVPITLNTQSPSLSDALAKLHELYCPGGYTISYGWVSEFWGTETYATGFYKNNRLTGSAETEMVSNGDYINAFIYYDDVGYSDSFTYFDKLSETLPQGGVLSLTLSGTGYDQGWNTVSKPISGAVIGYYENNSFIPFYDQELLPVTTDQNGSFSITMDTVSAYKLSADCGLLSYTVPICEVNVVSQGSYDANSADLEKRLEQFIDSIDNSYIEYQTDTLSFTYNIDDDIRLVWESSDESIISVNNDSHIMSINHDGYAFSKTVSVNIEASKKYNGVTYTACGSADFIVAADPELKQSAVTSLMQNIIASNGYQTTSNLWAVMDMAAYDRSALSDSAVQNSVDELLSLAASQNDTKSLAKAVIVLRSLGYGSSDAVLSNGSILNIEQKLKTACGTAANYSYAMWGLAANKNCGEKLDEGTASALLDIIEAEQLESGAFPDLWFGGSSVDETGYMLAALSSYALGQDDIYGTKNRANTIIDKAVCALSELQGDNGSFGNANSDALAIVGLCAVGINPDTDSRFIKNGRSLLDGLLLYVTPSQDGFDWQEHSVINDFATEQGFCALVSIQNIMSGCSSYNIFNHSQNSSKSPVASASGGTSSGGGSSSSQASKINVSFTINALSDTWLSQTIQVKKGGTVSDAIRAALGSGFSAVGISSGYISSITNNLTNETLSELDYGINSGWMFRVNGTIPSVGIKSYRIEDGDSVELFYTKDWSQLHNSTSSGASSSGGTQLLSDIRTHIITNSDINEALDKAVRSKAEYALIEVNSDDGTAVSASLSSEGLSEICAKNLALRLTSDILQITVDNAALSSISEQTAGGEKINLSIQKVDASSFKGLNYEALGDIYDISINDGKISSFGGGSVRLSLKADKDKLVENVDPIICSVLPSSLLVPLKSDIDELEVSASTNHLSFYTIAYDGASHFYDASPSYSDAMDFVSKNRIMTGTSANVFSPLAELDRKTAVTILYRLNNAVSDSLLQSNTEEPSGFSDVEAGTWYYDAVNWAAANAIVNGYPDKTFRPDSRLTAEELAVMLWRFAAYRQEYKIIEQQNGTSEDCAASAWAAPAVIWTQQNQILSLNSVSQPSISRAEAAEILLSYCLNILK